MYSAPNLMKQATKSPKKSQQIVRKLTDGTYTAPPHACQQQAQLSNKHGREKAHRDRHSTTLRREHQITVLTDLLEGAAAAKGPQHLAPEEVVRLEGRR